jgi:hypothetical protein
MGRIQQKTFGAHQFRFLATALVGALLYLPAASTHAQQLPEDPSTANVSGTITDSDGALVEGAKITLSTTTPAQPRTALTGSDGRFHFAGLPPGTFTLSVTAPGLAPGSASLTLHPGELYETPPIVLPIATANIEVLVTLSPRDIAEEQVHEAEQQRVIGFVPNYFVSYESHFAPLAAKQKFGLGFHVVFDPTTFLFAGVAAGIEQANNTFPGYGGGRQGFGKRYGAALALSDSATLFRGSIYPALFHQDPRYFYKGTGTVWQRTRYALATAIVCKGDNARWQPNYSGILGDLSAGALANAYYPASSRHGAALTFENGLLSTAGVGVGHVLQEFFFRRVTTHAKRPATTQP